VRGWIRDELGPEAKLADRLVEDVKTLARLPDLVRRIEARYPAPGGAPPELPLTEIAVVGANGGGSGWRYALTALLAGAAGAAAVLALH
jgi:ubiquinone biosynthesis protein